jgi:hypothetical protein
MSIPLMIQFPMVNLNIATGVFSGYRIVLQVLVFCSEKSSGTIINCYMSIPRFLYYSVLSSSIMSRFSMSGLLVQ